MDDRTAGRYDGKVAVVTGAGSGIGRAITEQLLREGASVVANDLDVSALAADESPGRLVTVAGDVSADDMPQRLLDAVVTLGGGRVDVLFNNAGIGSARPALDIRPDEWRRVMDVNVDAAFRLATTVGRVMVDQGAGAILNTASVAGTHGLPSRVAYVVSKHAIVGMTRALAVEWGPSGVRVNAICPGLTESGMSERLKRDSPDYWAAREAVVPLRRAGLSAEQASTALFLCSDEAAYISGMIAEVDGGTHALYAGYTVQRPTS
ncbi:SDR family oxidoreductase [Aeromicrobium senzhongii]|uniref:SDR family oxidoreductase n=1 Tax=Aeromicrobium senzhongii TaxID=2663859 RepID=A0ABX6SRV1_9ACTN|nr:SDR family NAD(P)-dependent oxidoreductase [Aeromicrobium senzhongii]QNL93771.1 SDR family oxidoreductase [Aeromicrobium senzhongii]